MKKYPVVRLDPKKLRDRTRTLRLTTESIRTLSNLSLLSVAGGTAVTQKPDCKSDWICVTR
jgi:hypothetical protein